MFGEPRIEAVGDALSLRHSADTGRMLHHSFAFCDRKLAEQKKTFAWRRRDPVGISTPRVQECRLCRSGVLLGELDQFVFDLKRAQRLEFAEFDKVHDFHLSEDVRTKA